MYETNVEKEKVALEEAVRKRKEEEQKAEEAASKLRQIQKEEDLMRIEGALRHRRHGEELKEAEKKLQRLEAEEQAVTNKKGGLVKVCDWLTELLSSPLIGSQNGSFARLETDRVVD